MNSNPSKSWHNICHRMVETGLLSFWSSIYSKFLPVSLTSATIISTYIPRIDIPPVEWFEFGPSTWRLFCSPRTEDIHRFRIYIYIYLELEWWPLHFEGQPSKTKLFSNQHKGIYTNIHTLHYITLHYITLHYITLHYITLHYVTLHYITLHYITLHTYILT